jgi:hypothetical protein
MKSLLLSLFLLLGIALSGYTQKDGDWFRVDLNQELVSDTIRLTINGVVVMEDTVITYVYEATVSHIPPIFNFGRKNGARFKSESGVPFRVRRKRVKINLSINGHESEFKTSLRKGLYIRLHHGEWEQESDWYRYF